MITDKVSHLSYYSFPTNISGEVDLMIISETKIDESFPQFLIKGFSDPFRVVQNIHCGGILLYVKEDIYIY